MTMEWLDFLLLAVVEGITEFLPVSSTGHMILFDDLFSLAGSGGKETFMVVIQVGAILAVVHLYLKGLLASAHALLSWLRRPAALSSPEKWGAERMDNGPAPFFLLKLAASVVPFGALGFLLRDQIKLLFVPGSVALALIVGGVVMICDDVVRLQRLKAGRVAGKADAWSWSWTDAWVIGVCQCLALWPGFSRSAASILGARWRGYLPEASAQLSFLIGVPTIVGTAGYEFLSNRELLSDAETMWLLPGVILAWFCAWISVKWFLKIVGRGGMAGFGVYRILLGAVILWTVSG
jgi:undecaprenyl-diphosphatase